MSSFFMVSLFLSLFLTFTILMAASMAHSIIEKKTQFECGFNNIYKNKTSFSTKFFLIMILFLVFDLEVAILLPSSLAQKSNVVSMIPPMLFVLMVTLAMIIEWFNGMIEWSN